jgi:23S rRNA (cytidine1920-2'-O)/16S rRNA (cytidine1409-2'-O)-methyltransferase
MSKSRTPRERLDVLLVARGLSPDLDQARRTIWAGEVLVDGDLVDQPGARCPVTAEVRLRGAPRRFATRGGEKLDHALTRFGIEVEARVVLDVGAAGGGFTDCLLARGASRVYAVEAGRGQLAPRLRRDPRVMDLGGRDVMALTSDELVPAPSLAVVDVTFRALSHTMSHVIGLLSSEWEAIALLKPLQEAAALGLGRPPDLQRTVIELVLGRFAEQRLPVRATAPAHPLGPGGALEFFLHLGPPGADAEALAQVLAAALAEGAELLARRSSPERSGQRRRKAWRTFRSRRARPR